MKKFYLEAVLHRSTLQLLRFHFSLFLLPVYLFALSYAQKMDLRNALLSFIILHFLIYPASNGYNSYMDRDDTPIGGLKNPLQPTKQLFYVTVAMDVAAMILSFFISKTFALCTLLYIVASRAYSYRGIRLKRFAVAGFLTVFFFQGALVFYAVYHAVQQGQLFQNPMLPAFTSSLLIGALYPLTQVYQHEADQKDGVITLSYKLGKRGSFLFSMLLFLTATVAMYFVWQQRLQRFYLFQILMLPVVLYFLYWMRLVWRDESKADFKHSLRMNLYATFALLLYFSTLILHPYFE